MRAILSAAGIALALTLTACSIGGSSNITVHGTEVVAVDILNGQSAADLYPDVATGSQVTVVDSSHKVIGTGTLSEGPATAQFGTDSEQFKFTVTVPDGLTRYGIEVGNDNRGTVWFSEKEMKQGPGLCLGDGC